MDNPLGQPSRYVNAYKPDLLYPMARAASRHALGVGQVLPFVGEDVWHGYELSWLDPQGKPRVAGLRLRVPASAPRMVESKSMKLYLNSFAQSGFPSAGRVAEVIRADLTAAVGSPVQVEVLALDDLPPATDTLPGECIDLLPLAEPCYERDPTLLKLDEERGREAGSVEESLHSHLFRSLCPVTGQPDWASILVRYAGPPVDRQGLLAYLVSFRLHQAYHESTVEQIFMDIKTRCGCERLTVAGFFVRRGGLDISPWRSEEIASAPGWRLRRQ